MQNQAKWVKTFLAQMFYNFRLLYGPLGLLLEDRNRKFDFDPLSEPGFASECLT